MDISWYIHIHLSTLSLERNTGKALFEHGGHVGWSGDPRMKTRMTSKMCWKVVLEIFFISSLTSAEGFRPPWNGSQLIINANIIVDAGSCRSSQIWEILKWILQFHSLMEKVLRHLECLVKLLYIYYMDWCSPDELSISRMNCTWLMLRWKIGAISEPKSCSRDPFFTLNLFVWWVFAFHHLGCDIGELRS